MCLAQLFRSNAIGPTGVGPVSLTHRNFTAASSMLKTSHHKIVLYEQCSHMIKLLTITSECSHMMTRTLPGQKNLLQYNYVLGILSTEVLVHLRHHVLNEHVMPPAASKCSGAGRAIASTRASSNRPDIHGCQANTELKSTNKENWTCRYLHARESRKLFRSVFGGLCFHVVNKLCLLLGAASGILHIAFNFKSFLPT
jgi:uncharacterized protein YceK